ncbi:MAG: DUF4350 domain-containing protein [Blastocatellia bacterium]
MKTRFCRIDSILAFLLILSTCLSVSIYAQGQQADPDFDASVAKPAYTTRRPRLVLDEAHNNFHTADGRYKPFATLLRNDGFDVQPRRQKFTAESLKGISVLVIANALGAPDMASPDAAKPAFTDAEGDALREWVKAGGALLLIADHAPIGGANAALSLKFGVAMSRLHTVDEQHADLENGGNRGWLVFSRENGLLGDHPILRGRHAAERVSRVATFTGQSLKASDNAAVLLRLSDTAGDYDVASKKEISAAGRAQGVAMVFGKGRLVIMGEAAMMTAQIAGDRTRKFGMNRPGNDNKQLTLNILRWLSRLY